MSNKIYGFGQSGASNNLYAYDMDAGTWVAVVTGMAAPVDVGNSSAGAWDGYYYYFFGTDNKLYRYDPGTNAVTVRAGGAVIPGIGNLGQMVCDGSYIWCFSNTYFGYYTIASNTFVSLARPSVNATGYGNSICWDYGNNLYIASANNIGPYAQRFDIGAQTWSVETAPPPWNGSGVSGSGEGCWFANNKLYLMSNSTKIWSLPVPGGTVWTLECDGLTGATAKAGVTVVDADRVMVRNSSFYSMSGHNSSPFANSPVGVAGHTYTLSIQPVFQFLEPDGATPQATPEPLGGSAARFFAGQTSKVYTFSLRCLFPRNTVQISLIANPSVDIASGVQIAPSPTGPWTAVANLGPFAAGQTKPYYVKVQVPNPVSPGQKPFTLLATST